MAGSSNISGVQSVQMLKPQIVSGCHPMRSPLQMSMYRKEKKKVALQQDDHICSILNVLEDHRLYSTLVPEVRL